MLRGRFVVRRLAALLVVRPCRREQGAQVGPDRLRLASELQRSRVARDVYAQQVRIRRLCGHAPERERDDARGSRAMPHLAETCRRAPTAQAAKRSAGIGGYSRCGPRTPSYRRACARLRASRRRVRRSMAAYIGGVRSFPGSCRLSRRETFFRLGCPHWCSG